PSIAQAVAYRRFQRSQVSRCTTSASRRETRDSIGRPRRVSDSSGPHGRVVGRFRGGGFPIWGNWPARKGPDRTAKSCVQDGEMAGEQWGDLIIRGFEWRHLDWIRNTRRRGYSALAKKNGDHPKVFPVGRIATDTVANPFPARRRGQFMDRAAHDRAGTFPEGPFRSFQRIRWAAQHSYPSSFSRFRWPDLGRNGPWSRTNR